MDLSGNATESEHTTNSMQIWLWFVWWFNLNAWFGMIYSSWNAMNWTEGSFLLLSNWRERRCCGNMLCLIERKISSRNNKCLQHDSFKSLGILINVCCREEYRRIYIICISMLSLLPKEMLEEKLEEAIHA